MRGALVAIREEVSAALNAFSLDPPHVRVTERAHLRRAVTMLDAALASYPEPEEQVPPATAGLTREQRSEGFLDRAVARAASELYRRKRQAPTVGAITAEVQDAAMHRRMYAGEQEVTLTTVAASVARLAERGTFSLAKPVPTGADG